MVLKEIIKNSKMAVEFLKTKYFIFLTNQITTEPSPLKIKYQSLEEIRGFIVF
jgi:hypothetical protein